MRDNKLPIFTRRTKRGRDYFYCHVRTARGAREQRALHIRDDGSDAAWKAACAAYWKEQARAAAGEGDRGDRTRKPLGEALDALRAEQELAGVTEGALDNTVNRGKRLMQHFTTTYDLHELSTQAMVEYAVKARETRAPTTVRGELDILMAAARAVGVKPPKRPRLKGGAKPQEPLTPAQVRLFFAALPYTQRLLGLALVTLGPRASEIAKIDDVDWDARTLWIYGTKTEGSRRQLPIPDELFAHMLELRRWGHWQGFPRITRQAIDKTVRKACKRAGIGPRSVNDLRGTWATLAALEGVSADVRAAWQGNSAEMQARTYSQPARMPEEMRRVAAHGVPRIRSSIPCIAGSSEGTPSAADLTVADALPASESQRK